MNENRVKLKKATQQISHFSQPFDPNEFNFTKVPEDDVIFSFKNVNGDLAGKIIIPSRSSKSTK